MRLLADIISVQATRDVVRMIWKTLLYALIGYLALCGIVFAFQRKLLYLPMGNQLSEQRARYEGLRHWPSLGNFQGFIGQPELIDAQGTVIVFHGNAGAAYHRSFYIDALSIQNRA